MNLRLSALGALALAGLVGCGVPQPPAEAVAPEKKAPLTNTDPDQMPKTKPATPNAKPAEEDPAKLGLKITDTKPGTGATAEPGDTLSMRYAGRLKSNGQEFDSNMNNGKPPFTFTLGSGQVIKGWDVGIRGMKAGGKRTLEIPSALGYGAQGGGDKIPPNSDLVFDVELLDVQKAADADTIQRETIKPGAGAAAKSGDVVTVTYSISTPDGKVADDNGGKPLQIKLGAGQTAFKGFDLAVEGMKAGQVVDVTVPPPLAFGMMGRPPKIAPNTTLKVHITLVKIG